MTIEIKEGRYFSRMWFIPGKGVDFMGALWREEGGPWIGQYRFRYYADKKAFESEDEKSWYRAEFPDPDEKAALAIFGQVIDQISKEFSGHLDMGSVHTLILNTSDPAKVFEAMRRENFCHIKEAPL